MTRRSTPPRLAVLTATGSAAAVVLRRGPSGRVMTLGWDRDSGAITPGQWLKGTIYEHRSDLSPDGRHLVVFAGTGRRWWTAVSRAPYLRAVWLCFQTSTWHGGGAFAPDGRLWLNGGPPSSTDLDTAEVRLSPDVTAFPHATDGFHMGGLFASRMQARGWTATGDAYDLRLTKPLAGGGALVWTIALGARNRTLLSNHIALDGVAPPPGAPGRWEWADVRNGAVQFAAKGCLWQASPGANGQFDAARLVHDFSVHTYDPVAAPYWAPDPADNAAPHLRSLP